MEHEIVHLKLRLCLAILFSLHWHVQMCIENTDLHNPPLNVYDLRQTDGTRAWRREEKDGLGWRVDPAAICVQTVLHWDQTESQISIQVEACVHLWVPAKSMESFIYMNNKNIWPKQSRVPHPWICEKDAPLAFVIQSSTDLWPEGDLRTEIRAVTPGLKRRQKMPIFTPHQSCLPRQLTASWCWHIAVSAGPLIHRDDGHSPAVCQPYKWQLNNKYTLT